MSANKALLSVVVCCAVFVQLFSMLDAAAIPITMPAKVPDEFKDFLPSEVTVFYNDLTDAEKGILKEMAENHAKYETEDAALADLKEKSEKLFNKAKELKQMLNEKLEKLPEGARAFINSLIDEVKKLKPKGVDKMKLDEMRTKAKEIMDKYKALSEGDKAALTEQFPKISGVIRNEKFQKLAQGLLKTSEGAAAAAPAA